MLMQNIEQEPNAQQVTMYRTARVKFPSGAISSFTIVPPHETNPGGGSISCDSPLGKALVGKRAGDDIIYVVENRVFHATVIELCPKEKPET